MSTLKKRTKRKTKRKKTKRKRTFTKKDYNSRDGMLTTVWGPSLWHTLHVMSFNYPNNPTEKDKKDYRRFVLGLKCTLPCGKCRKNLKKNLKEHPLRMKDLKNRETFSRWMYELHEIINRMLNKKSNLTYEQVRERYEQFRSRCTVDVKLNRGNIKNLRKKKTVKKKREDGCTKPLYGKKSKCLIRIVPSDQKAKTLKIDKRCIKKRK
tara:strand:+ start:584 stop:1207 length:624 start_codon:yes stop_codon:yes gene_type:complete